MGGKELSEGLERERGDVVTKFMLLFSLGPVQIFIAQARKTRDLWLGSYLLSMLMEAGMQDIKNQLIFPMDPNIKGDISDLPNKYIALFDVKSDALKAAQDSVKHVKTLWSTL